MNVAAGDIIRTKTGKCDRVVIAVVQGSTPEEIAAAKASGGCWVRATYVATRALRDGQPFGPVTQTAPKNITVVSSQGSKR